MSKRGENPYELNAPSEMPEGFGKEFVDMSAQNFFMKYSGIPNTFAGQLMYVGPIVNELCEDFNWYRGTASPLDPRYYIGGDNIMDIINLPDVYELRAPHQAKAFF
jgi:hypothetical protein